LTTEGTEDHRGLFRFAVWLGFYFLFYFGFAGHHFVGLADQVSQFGVGQDVQTIEVDPLVASNVGGGANAFLLTQFGKLLGSALETQALGHGFQTHDGEKFPSHLETESVTPLQVFRGLGERETILAKRINIHKRRDPVPAEKNPILKEGKMQTKQLGNSNLEITPVGYGAWAIGGSGWQFAWGAQNDEDSIAAIHRALALGVNWIDTAAIYGVGHSEEVVGRALKNWSGTKPYIFTKCGLIADAKGNVTKNLDGGSIRREVENSLRRLGVDVIDLYQIHWPPDPDSPKLEEGWSTMADLKKEGKVRWIGVSNFDVKQLRRAKAIAPAVFADSSRGGRGHFALLLAGRYWSDCLFSDGFGAADGGDDGGTSGEIAEG
jgi:Aldo/keto reductase family